MFYLYLGSSDHLEFHPLYMHLGEEYANLAETYLKSRNASAARLAIQDLGRILPDVESPDRERLEKTQRDLEKQLQKSTNKKN